MVAPAEFPGEHRGVKGCSQNTSYITSDTVSRIIVYVYRLHSPAVEILMGPGHDWIWSRGTELCQDGRISTSRKAELAVQGVLEGKNYAWRRLETGGMSHSRPSWAEIEGNTITQEQQQCSLHPWPPSEGNRCWASKYSLNKKRSYLLTEEIQLKETFFRHGWRTSLWRVNPHLEPSVDFCWEPTSSSGPALSNTSLGKQGDDEFFCNSLMFKQDDGCDGWRLSYAIQQSWLRTTAESYLAADCLSLDCECLHLIWNALLN